MNYIDLIVPVDKPWEEKEERFVRRSSLQGNLLLSAVKDAKKCFPQGCGLLLFLLECFISGSSRSLLGFFFSFFFSFLSTQRLMFTDYPLTAVTQLSCDFSVKGGKKDFAMLFSLSRHIDQIMAHLESPHPGLSYEFRVDVVCCKLIVDLVARQICPKA